MAQSTKCISNLNQIGKGYLMYALDYRDYMIPAYAFGGDTWEPGNQMTWPERLKTTGYVPNILTAGMRCQALPVKNMTDASLHYGAMFHCGGSKLSRPQYVYSAAGAFKKPENYMMMVDSVLVASEAVQPYYIFWRGSTSWDFTRWIHLRHNNRANILTAGGDVRSYSAEQAMNRFDIPADQKSALFHQ